jgi:hypothetical protein
MGTFLVNVTGCLLAGLLAGLVVKFGWFSPDLFVNVVDRCQFDCLVNGRSPETSIPRR